MGVAGQAAEVVSSLTPVRFRLNVVVFWVVVFWHAERMRRYKVAGGLLTNHHGLLLVANRRRNGRIDWSTPGGVVDDGETALEALEREITEETGLTVTSWHQLCWTVAVDFVDLAMELYVEVYRAGQFSGDQII